MDKFVISNKQNITQNLDENITNEQGFEYRKHRLKMRCQKNLNTKFYLVNLHLKRKEKQILNKIYYNIKILNKY